MDNRPLADSDRVQAAMRMFPYRSQTPGFYAAHNAHLWGASSFDNYRYPDPSLSAWIDELHRLLRTPGELERCRREHLSAAERAAIAREEASDGGL
jgi:hypothetical protein